MELVEAIDEDELVEQVAYVAVLTKSADPAIRGYAVHELNRLADAGLLKVGPKGYIHGWIKVGPGAVGDRVHHPEHGHGTVTRAGKRTTGVQFDSGHYAAFEHGAGKPGEHFVKRPGRAASAKPKPAVAVRKPFVASEPRATSPAPARTPSGRGYVKGSDRSKQIDYAKAMAGYDHTRSRAGAGDTALSHIQKEQGFDGSTTVVSKDDFDSALKRGEVKELWRGIAGPQAKDYAEQYRTGRLHPGWGINGNGTYVSGSKSVADYYGADYGTSSHGATLRIGLRKDARVIGIEELDRMMDEYFARRPKSRNRDLREYEQEYAAALAKAKSRRKIAGVRKSYRSGLAYLDKDPESSAMRDPGRFAAVLGYDAIDIPQAYSPDETPEMIILNRTATIVQDGQ